MISQVAIAVFGLSAIMLTQQKQPDRRKWAPILGLIAQPFWFYSTFAAEQWGIFALSFFYTYAWLIGLRNQWL